MARWWGQCLPGVTPSPAAPSARRDFLAIEEETGVSPSLVREWVRRRSLLQPREFGDGVGGRQGFLYETRALRFAEG